MKFGIFAKLMVSILLMIIVLNNCSDQKTEVMKTQIKLAVVGQSLIKMDPRKHWSDPFGSVKPFLESADVGFTNFEMAVNTNCGVSEDYQIMLGKPKLGSDRPGNTGGPHAVNENVMEFLSSMNFKLQSLANNHA